MDGQRAAQRLHITQSAISQRIKQLEQQFAEPLIIRSQPLQATGLTDLFEIHPTVEGALAEKVKGKDLVIVGLRPEHIKDASLGDKIDGVTFTANVDQTEWLGNEQYAYIPFEQDPAAKQHLDALEKDLDGEGARSQLVVNLDARSQIFEGDEVEFAFDPAHMHVFDPESGHNYTRNEEKATQIAANSEKQRKAALKRAQERDAKGAISRGNDVA